MRPDGPTSFYLSALAGWRQQVAGARIVAPQAGSLRLATRAGGPLALDAEDGSLGGLVLPRGVAIDADGTLYLLSPNDLRIRRYASEREGFVALPEVGGYGDDVRRFRGPRNIAIAGRSLAVADADAGRVLVFCLDTLALLDVVELPAGAPVDVCASADRFFILDGRRPRIYACAARPIGVAPLIDGGTVAGAWTRIAVDRAGRLYVLEAGARPVLRAFERDGRGALERWRDARSFADAGELVDRFPVPGIRIDRDGCIRVPASALRPCGRELPGRRWGAGDPPSPTPAGRRDGAVVLDAGDRRYVVDAGERRVEMYLAAGRKRRHVWGPWDANEHPVAASAPDAWEPVDVARSDEDVYILDRRHARVYVHRVGRETLRVAAHDPAAADRWGRLHVDEAGRLLVLDERTSVVRAIGAHGELVEVDAPPFPARPTSAGDVTATPDLVVDRDGRPCAVDPYAVDRADVWVRAGEAICGPLDSRIHDCVWDRMAIGIGDFPPGCAVEVSSFASNDGVRPPLPAWEPCLTLVAPLQEPPGPDGRFTVPPADCLVQSEAGRFLWLRLRLRGDGLRTPAIDAIRVHYPRQRLLDELPAVFSHDDESRRFLDRLLAAFRVEFDRIDRFIDDGAALIDPRAVPDGALLDFLASWLGVAFDGGWTWAQKRRLLTVMPRVLGRRGRVDGLKVLLAAYLSNVSSMPLAEIERLGFPMVLEGFRERAQRRLTVDGWRLGEEIPLATAPYSRRLRLDDPGGGERELVSVGTPDADWAAEYAHRFRVVVPAALVQTAASEQMLRRVIESEKPAHTHYDLCLVPSSVQVGVQSTLGIDMIVGEPPRMRLGCAADASGAPGAPPRNALGHTALLGGRREGHPSFALDRGARIGRETVLL